MSEESKKPKKPEETFKVESKPSDADKKATEEVGSFADKDAKRHEESKDTAHRLFIRGLKIVFWMAIVVLLLRTLHLVFPTDWHWLDESQLNTIDKILGAALGGGLIGRYLQKIFPEKSSPK